MTENKYGYTVVKHSGTLTGHDEFEHGLESRAVATKRQREQVERTGGRVFDTYGEAEAFAEAESYPAGHEGLVPAAPGTFSTMVLGGMPVYVPLPQAPHTISADYRLHIEHDIADLDLDLAMREAVAWLSERLDADQHLVIQLSRGDGTFVTEHRYARGGEL